MAPGRQKREPLKLAANNCDLFAVSIRVAKKDFLIEPFIKALPMPSGIREDFARDGDLQVLCNRRSRKIDYRADVDIHRAGKSSEVHFHVSLRPTTTIARDEEPPFAEDIFRWLRRFISKQAKVGLGEQAAFRFLASQYRSAFSLPLIVSGTLNPTGSEILEGGRMTSVTIDLPRNRAGIRSLSQYVTRKGFAILIAREVETAAEKLEGVESDIGVLATIARSSLQLLGRRKR